MAADRYRGFFKFYTYNCRYGSYKGDTHHFAKIARMGVVTH